MQFDEYKDILLDTFEKNKDMKVTLVSLGPMLEMTANEKYVGCVYCMDKMGRGVCVCINNSASKTMLYYPETKTVEYIGDLKLDHSYSTGVYYDADGCVYGFPRNSNKLLKIDINNKTVEEIDIALDASSDIANLKKHFGHHYGGTLVGDRIICPPRASKYALVIDLKNYTHEKIYSEIFEKNHYSCSVLHPNGKLYFMPLRSSAVAEFDPDNNEIRLIGEPSPLSLFGGAVYSDGCIYCFTHTDESIFRIDIANRKCEMVINKPNKGHANGSFGAIVHFNGKIYNIPGNSANFYEYDPRTNQSKIFCTFNDGRYYSAKWAGGVLLPNGNIFLVPCRGRFAAEISFDREPVISDDMLALIKAGRFNAL